MAEFTIRDPETGRTVRVRGDSAPSEAEIEQIFAAQPPQAAPAAPGVRTPEESQARIADLESQLGEVQREQAPIGPLNDPRGAVATIASGAVAQPVSGLAGLLGAVAGLVPGGESPLEKAGRFQAGTEEALTIDPVNPASARVLEGLGVGVESGIEAIRKPVAGVSGLAQLITGQGVEGAAETVRRVEEEGIGPTAGAALERVGAPPIVSTAAEILPEAVATVAGAKVPLRRAPDVPDPPPRPTVADPTGDVVSVGRPRLDEPVDVTPVNSETIVENLRKGKTDKLAAEVVPDVEIVDAAQRLGVDLNVEHYATSTAFQDVARALKSRPGSELLAGEVQALKDLATRADDLVTDIGGALDKGAVSDDILNSTRGTIDDLQRQADVAYGKVREAIPARARIQTDSVKQFLDDRLADLGGQKNLLSTAEKKLLNIIESGEDGSITYAALDRVRRDVGDGFNKRSGPFADDSQRVLREVYDSLSEAQNNAAEAFGVGELYANARDLVVKRKGLEDQAVNLFGRDASGSLVPKIRAAATGLPKGDVTGFNRLMKALPEARRGEVAATVLGELFGAGSRQGGALGTGFATTWRNLNRNKSARDALLKHLPAEARQRFDDIGRVMDAISRSNAKSLANPSGSAGPIIAALEKGTIGTKLYDLGKAGAGEVATTAATGVPGLSTILRRAGGGRPDVNRVQQADQFLTSQTFKDAVSVALEGDLAKANNIAQNSPQFKGWIKTVPEGTAEDIARVGFMSWLASEQEQE